MTDLFEKCGRIKSVAVPQDRITGRNKGFAFLSFEERSAAQEAKEKFEGYPVDGRRLRIDWDVGRDKKEALKPAGSYGERREFDFPKEMPRNSYSDVDYRSGPPEEEASRY